MLIVDRDNRHLYELYDLRWNGSQWTAGSGAFFDLNANTRRPDGWTSADAAGLAILPGLVRYDEVFGPDEIRHAFRVTVRATNGYVYPASHRAGSNSQALPMGARLRLKASKDLSPFTPEMRKIFRAMQRYGLIVADNGSDMYVSGAFDPRWNNDVLNPAFRSLSASDFDVVELGWRGGTTAAMLDAGRGVALQLFAERRLRRPGLGRRCRRGRLRDRSGQRPRHVEPARHAGGQRDDAQHNRTTRPLLRPHPRAQCVRARRASNEIVVTIQAAHFVRGRPRAFGAAGMARSLTLAGNGRRLRRAGGKTSILLGHLAERRQLEHYFSGELRRTRRARERRAEPATEGSGLHQPIASPSFRGSEPPISTPLSGSIMIPWKPPIAPRPSRGDDRGPQGFHERRDRYRSPRAARRRRGARA